MFDPRTCRVACDTMTANRLETVWDVLVDRLEAMVPEGLNLIIGGGVRSELQRPGSKPRPRSILLMRTISLIPTMTDDQFRVVTV